MALKLNDLVKISNLGPPDELSPSLQLYQYLTADTLAQVRAANYFDGAGKFLSVGDLIRVKAADGERTVAIATNTVVSGGHVTTSEPSKRFVAGQAVTATAADTIVTGLASVVACGATLDSDPGDDPMLASATVGDQAGAPAAGSIIVKTWKNTAGNDPTPVAATTFAKKVNWWAYGAG